MHSLTGGRPKQRGQSLARGAAAIALVLAACGGPQRPSGLGSNPGYASWYGEPQMTASGERFDKHALTAAHRTLPFGTRVRVTNTRNGRSVVVRINDRGPYGPRRRVIDVSEAAARKLEMIDDGVVPVTLEVVH